VTVDQTLARTNATAAPATTRRRSLSVSTFRAGRSSRAGARGMNTIASAMTTVLSAN
jgi:hypothetical protein